MTLYKLDEWEHNGRDDSDWYAVVYDSELDKLERYQTGTTRFASSLHHGPQMLPPSEEILLLAEKCLAKIIFNQFKLEEKRNVFEPEDVNVGDRVSLLEKHRNKLKECDIESCIKCNGSGKWTNPKNSQDKRDCFGCKGSGKIKSKWRAVLKDGKPVWKVFEPGTNGLVQSCMVYGAFYANGYKQPGRENRQVIFVTDEGQEIKAPLSKLRLYREPKSESLLEEMAVEYSKNRNFYVPFRTAGFRL